MRAAIFPLLCITLAATACGPDSPSLPPQPIALEKTPQRDGTPERGFDALVNVGYVSCGVPFSIYEQTIGLPAPIEKQLAGRNALNEGLPFNYTAFDSPGGVRLVSANCLACHAAPLFGTLTMGLGNPNLDFTSDIEPLAKLAGQFTDDPAEIAEWQRWYDRVRASSPALKMTTVGANPADNLAVVLPAHRDQKTLAWSNELLMPLPKRKPVPVDVPPWWNMKKKHAMFITGFGQGDHARMMMSASMLCTDTVDEARGLDTVFPDIAAYISSIQPPKYPFAIDPELAEHGRSLFESTCSRCHGTYGDEPTYPNVVVPLELIGTDARLSAEANALGQPYIEWYNGSFYGELSALTPMDGYVAPPLDGVWATAPYLHNGSVPDLITVLESAARPTFWTRSFQAREEDFDAVNVGWKYTRLDHGKADEPDGAKKARLIDTTLEGYRNTGHTFGDALTPEERRAVVEYLKTL